MVKRKHTSGIKIESHIPESFDMLLEGYSSLESSVQELKYQMLSIDEAKLVTVRAAETKAIPSCDILPVLKEFNDPRHEEFSMPTMWSLYNAFTEIAKKYRPARADQCYRRLADLFALA